MVRKGIDICQLCERKNGAAGKCLVTHGLFGQLKLLLTVAKMCH